MKITLYLKNKKPYFNLSINVIAIILIAITLSSCEATNNTNNKINIKNYKTENNADNVMECGPFRLFLNKSTLDVGVQPDLPNGTSFLVHGKPFLKDKFLNFETSANSHIKCIHVKQGYYCHLKGGNSKSDYFVYNSHLKMGFLCKNSYLTLNVSSSVSSPSILCNFNKPIRCEHVLSLHAYDHFITKCADNLIDHYFYLNSVQDGLEPDPRKFWSYLCSGEKYLQLKHYQQAIKYFNNAQQYVVTNFALGALDNLEGQALRGVGHLYNALFDFESSLHIAKEFGEGKTELKDLGDIVITYSKLGNMYKVKKYEKKFYKELLVVSDKNTNIISSKYQPPINLIYTNSLNQFKFHKTINFKPYLAKYPNATLVIYAAGAHAEFSHGGGLGGITVLKVPLSTFVKRFGNRVTFYYLAGGMGGLSADNSAVTGGGASMVAVGNWPHDGGTTLAIGGGGGGGVRNKGWYGGGGGGGNDPGENGKGIYPGQGGSDGKGGNSGPNHGGPASPHLIDICGGGGGGWKGYGGAGGGTGGPGQGGDGTPNSSGYGGEGFQGGGNGGGGSAGFGKDNHNIYNTYEGGISGGNGLVGGEGGGGGSSAGVDGGGGGGYGGGGGGWQAGGGGGGGYCNNSVGTCQASDWTNGGGNHSRGYVYIYLKP